jgi:hypothetical protein
VVTNMPEAADNAQHESALVIHRREVQEASTTEVPDYAQHETVLSDIHASTGIDTNTKLTQHKEQTRRSKRAKR